MIPCDNELDINSPERMAYVDQVMSEVSCSIRFVWCSAMICGCLGCANKSGGVMSKITHQDWVLWQNRMLSLYGM